MKKQVYFFVALAIVLLSVSAFNKKQTEPWTPDQLMQPEKLAAIMNDSTAVKPIIISVGPVDLIKGAIKTGPAKEKENLKGLKKLLSNENRNIATQYFCDVTDK